VHLRPFFYLFALCLLAIAAGGQTITSFTPTYGQPGSTVTITGTGFLNATEVDFNGHPTTAQVMDQFGTQMNATVPSTSTVGYNYITIKKSGSSNTSTNPFTIIGAGPYIASFQQSAAVGSTITITGAHFTPFQTGAGTIKFGSVIASYYAPTTDQQLTVIVPPNATNGPLTAITSAGTWTSTNLFYFPPGITSFSPTNGRPGTNIVIKGTNFIGVTAVAFGAFNAIVYTTNSNTQITATVPEGASSGALHVFTQGGQSITSSNFFVVPNVVSFSPAVGDVGTTVTINGTNLNGSGLVVRFNGVQATVTSTSSSQLQAIVPSGAMSGAITVQTADGFGSSPDNFFMPPVITGISPTSAPVGGTVTISGRNLTNATAVQFNGINATSFTVVTNTQITAVVPAGPTSGQVTVVTPGGSTQSSQAFFGSPVITSVNPPSGVVGVDVTISGTNFFGLTGVQFNGVNAVTSNPTTNSIVATVPSGATTGPITLLTLGGNVNSGTFFIEPLILAITNLDDATVRLSWTTNAPGFNLQSATNLLSAGTHWSNDTTATQVLGGFVTVTNKTTGIPQKFYRLRK
jgi:hypothetical protein